MNILRGDLPERLAAEFALGTLRGPARRRFETLLPAHPTLQRAVASWERALLPMALRAAPVTPSPATWTALEARLGWTGEASPAAARTGAGAGASADAGARAGTGRTVGAGALRLWQSLTALASVVAIVLATMVRLGPAEAPMVVVLHATSGNDTLVAGVSPDLKQLSIQPIQPVSISPQKSLELWVIPKGKAPVSLGVISTTKLTAVSRGALPKDADKLAVTLEPLGGSPTGKPTGAVVFVGDVTL